MSNFNNLLAKANSNLAQIFGDKIQSITIDEIESVYDRDLLSVGTDAKTVKGETINILTGVLYLAPANLCGVNLCPGASDGCKTACLFTAGRGIMRPVYRARVIKSLALFYDRQRFQDTLSRSIERLVSKARKRGMIPAIRLNGTSDLPFESIFPDLFKKFSDIQFYDYTKLLFRLKNVFRPKNLDLTFSRSESNENECIEALRLEYRVAVVFDKMIPETYLGIKVINGDETDARFLDAKSIIVGLKAKGKARKDVSGFVVQGLIDNNGCFAA